MLEATTNVTNVSVTQIGTGLEDVEDIKPVIQRLTVAQDLSAVVKDGVAACGDLVSPGSPLNEEGKLNRHNGRAFIPLNFGKSNCMWNDELEAECRSNDGVVSTEGITCASCGKCEFGANNSKPQCTKYIDVLGVFEGDTAPVTLSFSSTAYAEGKRLIAMAKAAGGAIYAYKYIIDTEKRSSGKRDWYTLKIRGSSPVSAELISLVEPLFIAAQEAKRAARSQPQPALSTGNDNSLSF